MGPTAKSNQFHHFYKEEHMFLMNLINRLRRGRGGCHNFLGKAFRSRSLEKKSALLLEKERFSL